MIILRLAWHSLLNRKVTVLLTVLSIAISVALLLGVEKVRSGAKESFLNTISGTDLVIGARAGSVQLLLYSVFRIGDATSNITWETVEAIKRRPEVKWVVPITLGDSHRGFRVMGTSKLYFDVYRYRRNVSLKMAQGKPFEDLFDAVVGAEVARKLNYRVGQKIIVAHGTGRVQLGKAHDDKPFVISGILEPTGTPVDRTVHISMEAYEAIHVGWERGSAPRGDDIVSAEAVRQMDLSPKATTALYVGLRSRIMTFSLQRWANNYREEAITAILPGVAFGQLWSILGNVEAALLIISGLVVFTALLGMVISILGSLNERRREMALLRAIGARPLHIFGLFTAEAASLVGLGAALGMGLVYGLLATSRPLLESITGLDLPLGGPSAGELTLVLAIVTGGIVAGIIPAVRAYSLSLSDGLTVRT
ncbi:MAG: ABC transporter permease [Pseudomonadota bacterium]